eukprot:NODE_318_length_1799_cov_314.980571_g257_i0.p1 GENE.NODE_318_length_1799_cov_314.980571_g257_i0~~NODE_318_length_1799_cov_314.980571_g257_i0.p1  ORF type:complete len:306 (-),score=50.09 NODE_318_length_1799_cov_314.980571_g257_i0:530-1447(-)
MCRLDESLLSDKSSTALSEFLESPLFLERANTTSPTSSFSSDEIVDSSSPTPSSLSLEVACAASSFLLALDPSATGKSVVGTTLALMRPYDNVTTAWVGAVPAPVFPPPIADPLNATAPHVTLPNADALLRYTESAAVDVVVCALTCNRKLANYLSPSLAYRLLNTVRGVNLLLVPGARPKSESTRWLVCINETPHALRAVTVMQGMLRCNDSVLLFCALRSEEGLQDAIDLVERVKRQFKKRVCVDTCILSSHAAPSDLALRLAIISNSHVIVCGKNTEKGWRLGRSFAASVAESTTVPLLVSC